MMGSFLEGARAAVRRAGAVGLSTDSVGGEKTSLQSSQGMPHPESSSSVEEGGTAGRDVGSSSAAQSVSRPFSLLRASGARAILPVKKALGGDPEVVEARESLNKYKAKLSAAVAEAATAAATRREERELLTRALAGQDNDLRSWGYLSVLPTFREHRRKETSRAQLLVSMAERREEVISAKLQEVVQLLRSLPIIGPWNNKQRPGGTASTAVAGGGSGGQNRGFGNGRYYEEEFAVAPADLLAFDEELALARRRLLSCDRECAAAADAFAMKVVAAGGLEPRSSEDRTETLLSLLSRYHVLGDETVTAVCSNSTSEEGRPPAAAAAAKDGGKRQEAQAKKEEEEGGVTVDQGKEAKTAAVAVRNDSDRAEDQEEQEEQEETTADPAAADATENQTEPKQGRGATDESDDETTVAADPEEDQDQKAPNEKQQETAGDEKKQEETDGHQEAEQNAEGVAEQAEDTAAQETEAVQPLQEVVNPREETEPTGEALETGTEQEAVDATGGKGGPVKTMDPEAVPTKPDRDQEKATAMSAMVDDDGDGSSEDARRRAAAMRAGFSTRTREECEEAFVELMLDERNREGRLLRRFLTMAQAKKSPPAPSSSSSSSSAAAAPPRPRAAAADAKPDSRGRPAGVGASVGYKIADAAAGAFSSMRARARGGSGHESSGHDARGGGQIAGAATAASADRAAVHANAVGEGEGARTAQRWSAAGRTVTGEDGGAKGREEEEEEEDWDGSGGPQVVKAFINYFSKEYLVSKFHVPDVLVPSLTELVALLVFRQARRLVLGYDRRRVMENDLAWREKARTVRLACLLELGAPPEYIPASRTNALGTEAETVTALPSEATEAGARKEQAEPAGSGPTDDADQGADSSSSDGAAAAAVPPKSTSRTALPTGAEAWPAGVAAGAPALSEGLVVATSAVQGEEVKTRTGGHEEETAAVASTFEKERQQEKEKNGDTEGEQHREEEEEEEEEETEEGSAYARASREFERIGACTTPAEMLGVVKAGVTSLCDEAARISGSDKPLDADTLLPLLVHALAHADLPRVHEALNFLRNFRGPSWGGEDAYCVTCIEAAVSFVVDWNTAANDPGLSAAAAAAAAAADDADADADATALHVGRETVKDGDSFQSKTAIKAPAARRDGGGGGGGGGGGDDDGDDDDEYDAAVAARRAAQARQEELEQQEKGREALLRLGIFLEKHEVQEDTVDVLSSAGWL